MRFLQDHAWVSYNTSKSAVLQMARSMACELGPKRIRVNTLSPGHIYTKCVLGRRRSRSPSRDRAPAPRVRVPMFRAESAPDRASRRSCDPVQTSSRQPVVEPRVCSVRTARSNGAVRKMATDLDDLSPNCP